MESAGSTSGSVGDAEDEAAEAIAARLAPPPDSHTGLPAPEPLLPHEPAGLAALSDRFPGADGARAVASLGVVLTHVGLLSGFNFSQPAVGQYFARADVGVSIFFVLSGFLLYRPLVVRRFAGQHQGDVGRYARRRALRIFPAYWVALTIVGFIMKAPGFGDTRSIIEHYLLIQIYDADRVVMGPIDQAWSLATEVSFYIFLPLWAWLLARRNPEPRSQLRREVVSLTLLWSGCIALNLAVIAMGVSGPRFGQFGTWLPFRVHEFAAGMALAVASAWFAHRGRGLPASWTGTRLVLVCWGATLVLFWAVSSQLGFPSSLDFSPTRALSLRILYSLIGLGFVLPVVMGRQDGRGIVHTLLANRVMVWLGLVSYGIYIWHKAFQYKYLEWTNQIELQANFKGMLVVTLGLSIVAAAFSWYLIEKPLMRRRDRVRTGRTA